MDVPKVLEFLVLCARRELIELKVPLEQLESEITSLWNDVFGDPLWNGVLGEPSPSELCDYHSTLDKVCTLDQHEHTPSVQFGSSYSLSLSEEYESATSCEHCFPARLSTSGDPSVCNIESPEVPTTSQSHDCHVTPRDASDCHVTPRDTSLLQNEHGYSAQLSASDDVSMCNIETPEVSHVLQSHDSHGTYVYTPQSHDNHVSHTPRDGSLLQISVQQSSPSNPPQHTSTPEPCNNHPEPCHLASNIITSESVDRSPSHRHSPSSRWSDDSDADTKLEQLFTDMKLQNKSKNRHISSRKSLCEFIVSDSEEIVISSDDDTENVPPSCNTPYTVAVERPRPVWLQGIPLQETKNLSFSSPDLRECSPCTKMVPPPTTPSASKNFARSKNVMVRELFEFFNCTIFDNQLPEDTEVKWNKKLRTTAGYCYYRGLLSSRTACIELSTKVCDSYERVRDTLLHEMCHAATWVVDAVKGDGHGRYWQAWAARAKLNHPGLTPVTRCHNFDIVYKFTYQCTRCGYRIGRHSKSVNLLTTRCPLCLSYLKLLPRLRADGTPVVGKRPNQYALFVKENYSTVKAQSPQRTHKQVMEKLSAQYHASKTSHTTLDNSFTH